MFWLRKNKEMKEKERQLIMQREAQLKREKEMKAKFEVKKKLNLMKSQTIKLERTKLECIEKAKRAMQIGDQETCKIAKAALKRCLTWQKKLDSFIAVYEVMLQTGEMQKVFSGVSSCIETVAKEMKNIMPEVDITKAQMAYEDSLKLGEEQFQAIDEFLGTATDNLKAIDLGSDAVLDEEIDKLINNEVIESEANMDKEIDKKLDELKKDLQD